MKTRTGLCICILSTVLSTLLPMPASTEEVDRNAGGLREDTPAVLVANPVNMGTGQKYSECRELFNRRCARRRV